MEFLIGKPISSDSWLQEEKYKDFRKRYRHALTQTRAIPALAKLTPEETYFVFEALTQNHETIST